MFDIFAVHVSWLGVLLGAIAMFVLGGIWFTVLFGRAYREELGVPEAPEGEKASAPGLGKALVGQFIAGLAIATALAFLVGNTSVAQGAMTGLAGGVLVAAALVQLYQFEGRSLRHLLINTGYALLGITVIGAILGAFQAA